MKLELLDCGRLARGCVWLGCLLAASGVVWAKTVYVSLDGDDLKSGLDSWENAVASISQGVAKANASGDVVLVSNGTYNLNDVVTVGSGIIVTSLYGRTETFVNGQDTYRCFYINHAGAVLDGFTITNGAGKSGGAVQIAALGGTVKNCIITRNRSTQDAGGVKVDGGGMLSNCVVSYNSVNMESGWTGGGVGLNNGLIVDCQIYENHAKASGGGIYTFMKGVVRRCFISNNYSYITSAGNGGGGMAMRNGTSLVEVAVADSVIANNWSANYGGGLFIWGTATVARCTIVSNEASYGGGIYCYLQDPYIVISNCNISWNYATNGDGHGGGVYFNKNCFVSGSHIIGNHANRGAGVIFSVGGALQNCLVAGNTAYDVLGGAVMFYAADDGKIINCTVVSNASLNSVYGGIGIRYGGSCVYNTIAQSNTGSSVHSGNDIYIVADYLKATGVVYNSCAYNTNSIIIGYNNIEGDPAFANYGAGDFRLKTGSRCIDKGDNQWVADGQLDLDGRRRIRYGIVDMGAYEYIRRGTFFSVH